MSHQNAKIFAFHRLCLVAANRLFTYSFTRPEKPPVEYVAPQHRRHLIYLATRRAGVLGASNGGVFWGPLDGKSQILRVDQISNQLISDESSWMNGYVFPASGTEITFDKLTCHELKPKISGSGFSD